MLFALPQKFYSQPKSDSIILKENLKKLDKTLNDVKVLDKKLERKEKSFYEKILYFFTHFKRDNDKKIKDSPIVKNPNNNQNILKPKSETQYCEEDCTEIVERSFFGKLFNKSKYKIRTYRYENNKKIYLD